MIATKIEHALTTPNDKERYEYVYDVICSYLDKEFGSKNLCEFADGKCFVNRTDESGYRKGGCCYSYQYKFFTRKIVGRTPCKYLGDTKTYSTTTVIAGDAPSLINETSTATGCTISCISCKLYVCKPLRKKGVTFKISDFPDIDKVFNKKQIKVLESNHFRPKEQIIEKLLKTKKGIMPYFLFVFFDKATIKKPKNDAFKPVK